ncbi:MAG: DUF4956 domain-containing protein [Clostridia bacterium]|nr:DUF4956 domain-containing protein [Clostridia bacterium]
MINTLAIIEALSLKDYFTAQIGLGRILLTLLMSLAVGLIIFFVYKKTFAGVMYSRNLNVSYVMLTMVTSLMLMLINNNLTLSLGMVGALSIIRFRTAIKDPVDTVFMFWAVGEGIAIGVAYFVEAVIAVVVIGIILILMSIIKLRQSTPYIVILHYTEAGQGAIKRFMHSFPGSKIKSKSVSGGKGEITIELRAKPKELNFVEKLAASEGITDAMAVAHNGDVVA